MQTACTDAQTTLAALPDRAPTDGPRIVERMRAENRVLRTMIEHVRAVRPTGRTEAAALAEWAADWTAVVDARQSFTVRLAQDKRAQFLLPAGNGGLKPITGRMDDYVRQNHPLIDACLTDALQVEAVDSPRSYPDA